MRFCLFKPGQPSWLQASCLGLLAWLALTAGCTGSPFTSGQPATGGNGGAAAGGESGGEAGTSDSGEGGAGGVPSNGNAGEAPSGGSAGKPAAVCDCVAGEYCQDGTNRCRPCAELSRFEFGAEQKLGTLSQSARSIERFARPAAKGSSLFYVSGALDNSKIWYTAVPVSGVGMPVTLPTELESAPLFATGFADAKTDQNFFFDRIVAGKRKIHMGHWTAPAAVTDASLMPEPINLPDVDDYSVAISPETWHVYWMSTRNNEPELLRYAANDSSGPSTPSVLDLKIKAGKSECHRSGDDATPWVNAAGTLLLFRNPSLNENCEANDSGATDLFAAPLDKDGTPLAAATPLAAINITGGMSYESDPALSNDACTIYFASDRGTGDFDLYKAPRN